jgi:hypothetical protein
MLEYDVELERINRRKFLMELARECQHLANIEILPKVEPISYYGNHLEIYDHTKSIIRLYNQQKNDLISKTKPEKPCVDCNFCSYKDTYRCIVCHNNRELVSLNLELPIEIYRKIFSYGKINPLTINNEFFQLALPNYLKYRLPIICKQEYVSDDIPLIRYYLYMEPEQGYNIVSVEICEVIYQRKPIIAFKCDYSVDYNSKKYYNIEITDQYDWNKNRYIKYKYISIHNCFGKSLEQYCDDMENYFKCIISNKEKQRIINKTYKNDFKRYLKRSLQFKISYFIALAYVCKNNNHDINIPNFKILDTKSNNIYTTLEEYAIWLEIQIREIMNYGDLL